MTVQDSEDISREETENVELRRLTERIDRKPSDASDSDRVTLFDVGNGLLILGAIILVCYFVLLLVSYRAGPEAGSGMGNLGNWFFYTIIVSAALICAGSLLRIFTDGEGT